MPRVPEWFEHTRCSSCEHFIKPNMTCGCNTDTNPMACGKHNKHELYKSVLPKLKQTMTVKLPKNNVKPVDPHKTHGSCEHCNLVALEVVAGKRVYKGENNFMDWTSNIINAHSIRVTRYWCPSCDTIIKAPEYGSD